jgi:hypothetical protein
MARLAAYDWRNSTGINETRESEAFPMLTYRKEKSEEHLQHGRLR